MASSNHVQKLIDARSQFYGEAFNTLSVEGIMSWQSKNIVFNDISMDHYAMSYDTTLNFFTRNLASMKSMQILEATTTGDEEFVAWEMLIEVEYDIDEPQMGIKKGSKARIRGTSLQWWKWEGEGRWNGKLDKQSLEGWKITKENDYMVALKKDWKGEREDVMG